MVVHFCPSYLTRPQVVRKLSIDITRIAIWRKVEFCSVKLGCYGFTSLRLTCLIVNIAKSRIKGERKVIKGSFALSSSSALNFQFDTLERFRKDFREKFFPSKDTFNPKAIVSINETLLQSRATSSPVSGANLTRGQPRTVYISIATRTVPY